MKTRLNVINVEQKGKILLNKNYICALIAIFIYVHYVNKSIIRITKYMNINQKILFVKNTGKK